MTKIRVGLLQHIPEYLSPDENLRVLERFIAEAQRMGVQIFVTCEAYLDGGICARMSDGTNKREMPYDEEALLAVAQRPTGPYLDRVRKIARNARMHILLGLTMRAGRNVTNSAFFVDDTGTDIGVYTKTHLRENEGKFVLGNDLKVFETKLGTIGILICKDRGYPEAMRVLRLKGARLILNPSWGGWDIKNTWMMRTRASENKVPIAFAHPSTSLVCDSQGGIAGMLTTNVSSLLVTDIGLSPVDDRKIHGRRPDLYGILTEPKENDSAR